MELSKAAAVRSDINVTPLVDVVLVLLIIFMVVTPMLQRGQAVKLPITANPGKKPDDKDQVLVVLGQDKQIWIEKERMSEEVFDSRIRETYQRQTSATVVVKADARLTYGDVKNVILKVKKAGFEQVGLIAEKKDG